MKNVLNDAFGRLKIKIIKFLLAERNSMTHRMDVPASFISFLKKHEFDGVKYKDAKCLIEKYSFQLDHHLNVRNTIRLKSISIKINRNRAIRFGGKIKSSYIA